MSDSSSSPELDVAASKIDAAVAAGKISAAGAIHLKSWLTKPAYRRYQPKLLELVGNGKFAELDALFWEVIPFGTGGRRGRMAELGSATINDRTIAESAHGMAVYLKKVKGQAGGRAVIAHDTRNRSADFARITATTLAAHGLNVFLFDGHRSTPELSFAVRHLSCDIGVMISASHNPPSDNGFKAYWSDGAQVLPPHDRGIIECVVAAGEIPTVDYDRAVRDGSIQIVGETVDRAYISAVAALSLSKAREVHALFTPLHGVGETSVFRVLREAGFERVELFGPQSRPDGDFPNVPKQLPNPELPGVFGPAIEEAKKIAAELVLASDPDADRLGVAVTDGQYRQLTGNQVGALLADYVLRKRAAAGTLTPDHFVTTTLVTTPMFRAVSAPYGVRVVDDLLVGFKYIAQTMESLGADKFVFGAEESLGYLAGTYCRDKDAAIAALYILELAAELKQRDQTLVDRLDELYEQYGYFLEGQRSESCQGLRGKEQIDSLMRRLRTKPPEELGGVRMAQLRDFSDGTIRRIPGGEICGRLFEGAGPRAVPKGDLLFLESVEGPLKFSIAARPSGTEPKIKFYFFARAAVHGPSRESLYAVKDEAAETMDNFQSALASWVQNVLSADTPST